MKTNRSILIIRKTKFIQIFLTILFFIPSQVEAKDFFKKHDQKMYKPQNEGLKDLTVEIRIDKLKDVLNQRLIFGKIEDLYFKLHWAAPNKRAIEIIGMPEGFKEARAELKRLAEAESQYLIQADMVDEFKGFDLSYTTRNKKEVMAIDPSYKSPASEVSLRLDQNGIVKKVKRVSAIGTEVAEFGFKALRSKFMVDSIEITSRKGLQKTITEKKFNHQDVEGFKLLENIDVSTTHRLEKINRSRLNNLERKIATQVTFRNYQINSGEAVKYIRKSAKQSE